MNQPHEFAHLESGAPDFNLFTIPVPLVLDVLVVLVRTIVFVLCLFLGLVRDVLEEYSVFFAFVLCEVQSTA